MNVKIFLADGFEEIEAITLIDILKRANYHVITVSITLKHEVVGSHSIPIIANTLLTEVDLSTTDLLVFPGGMPGVANLVENTRIIEIVREFDSQKKNIAAICAAPYLLYKSGILKDKKITVYPTWAEKIKDCKVLDEPVVIDGNIITGQGVGAAIDLGLKLVELFSSIEESKKLKEAIVYKRH